MVLEVLSGISANNTGYLALQVSAGPVALEPQTQIVMPQGGTFSALYILTSSAQPASGSLVITLRFGGVSQAIQVTIPSSSPAGIYSDTAHTAPFSTGNLVNYQVTNNASVCLSRDSKCNYGLLDVRTASQLASGRRTERIPVRRSIWRYPE